MKSIFAFLALMMFFSLPAAAQGDAAQSFAALINTLKKGTPQAADDAVTACEPKELGYTGCVAVRGIAYGIKKDIPKAVSELQLTELDRYWGKETSFDNPQNAAFYPLIQQHVKPYYDYLEGNWSKDPKITIAKIQSAVAAAPQFHKAWSRLSDLQVEEKNYQAALESIGKAIAFGPPDKNYLFQRADVYITIGDEASRAKAIADVKKGIAEDKNYGYRGKLFLVELGVPGEIPSIKDLFEHCSGRKNIDAGIACYSNAIKYGPDEPEHMTLTPKWVLHSRRAKLFYEKKLWAEAAADYEIYVKSVVAERGTMKILGPVTLNEVAASFINAKKYQPAIEMASLVIEMAPADVFAYYLRAKGNWGLKKLDPALADYTKAIQIKPTQALWNDRAHVLMEKGDNKAAIPDLQQVIKLDPNNEDAKKHLKELGATP